MFSDSIDGVGLDLLGFVGDRRFATILADPPWQFTNKTGKVAPEHRRLSRYRTLTLEDIKALPVAHVAAQKAHLYLWCPNALLPEGLAVMEAWGFSYKCNIVWHKVRKDAAPMAAALDSISEMSRNSFCSACAGRVHER